MARKEFLHVIKGDTPEDLLAKLREIHALEPYPTVIVQILNAGGEKREAWIKSEAEIKFKPKTGGAGNG